MIRAKKAKKMKNEMTIPLVEFTFLGQDGFFVQTKESGFLIDPYLSNYVVDSGLGSAEVFSRQFPVPVRIEDLKNIDAVFITHDHGDHCDPETLLPLYHANPLIKFICPKPVGNHLASLGISPQQIIIPKVGKVEHLPGLDYYAVPAAHYQFDLDESGENYAYFGFVIKAGEVWIYHAGDTILYDGMVEQILGHTSEINVACLPVNGRDGWRERMDMIGNLDPSESLELALRLKTDVLLPMHNDLFKYNHISPAVLADHLDRKAPRQKVHWLQPGERYFYVK